MKTMFLSVLEKIICAACIFAFCQFPAFFDEYLMRLSGHVAECTKMVDSLEAAAAASHKELSAYIASFQTSREPDVQNFAVVVHSFVEREKSLEQAKNSLQNASILAKPFLFIRYMDSDIVNETITNFRMQLSFSLETVFYAIIGLCFSLILTRGVPKVFTSSKKQTV